MRRCIEWIGARTSGGYGHGYELGIHFYAHRRAYEQAHGHIPVGLLVRHKCDNPSCVNPSHLELGTSYDNSRDMVIRGRRPDTHGEANPRARLTARDVVVIRELINFGVPKKGIALMYGVERTIVRNIGNGKRWASVK